LAARIKSIYDYKNDPLVASFTKNMGVEIEKI
jgi:hypothetical protein